jgi:hypothetical protein
MRYMPKSTTTTKKKPPAKKKPVRKDAAQTALSVVEQAIGGKLAQSAKRPR